MTKKRLEEIIREEVRSRLKESGLPPVTKDQKSDTLDALLRIGNIVEDMTYPLRKRRLLHRLRFLRSETPDKRKQSETAKDAIEYLQTAKREYDKLAKIFSERNYQRMVDILKRLEEESR